MGKSRSRDLGWRGRELILRTRAWPDGTVPLSAPRQVQAKPLTRVWTPRGAANQSAFESLPTLGCRWQTHFKLLSLGKVAQ